VFITVNDNEQGPALLNPSAIESIRIVNGKTVITCVKLDYRVRESPDEIIDLIHAGQREAFTNPMHKGT